MRLHCIDLLLHIDRQGPRAFDCHRPVERGEELGWFEHGSTIIVFAPQGVALAAGLAPGQRIRMGQPLMQLPPPPPRQAPP
jgi:phosphatidylserine decarboxylase